MIKAIETHYNGYRFRSRLEARWAVFFDALGIEYQYEPEGFDLGEAGWYLPDFWLPQQKYWIEIKGTAPTPSEMRKAHLLAEQSNTIAFILFGQPWIDEHLILNWEYQTDPWYKYTAVGFFGDHTTFRGYYARYFHQSDFERLQEFLTQRQQEGYHFSKPIPKWSLDETTIQCLIQLDKEYFYQRYGKPHWRWTYGDSTYVGEIGTKPARFETWLWWQEEDQFFIDASPEPWPNHKTRTLIEAYQTARSARFEHGETPTI